MRLRVDLLASSCIAELGMPTLALVRLSILPSVSSGDHLENDFYSTRDAEFKLLKNIGK